MVPGPRTHFEVEGIGTYDNATLSEVLLGFGLLDSVVWVLSSVSI